MGRTKINGLIPKTILSGFSLIAFSSFSTSAAADGDPALTPRSAASAAASTLEAASPSTPAASAPTAAASASTAAASAPAVPASAPAAAPPAPVQIESAALSTGEFYGFSFAVSDATGIGFNTKLESEYDDKIWRTPVENKAKGIKTMLSQDGKMAFEFAARRDGGYETITMSKRENRARMTVFKDKKPVSHTIITESGRYTATPSFCEALKKQTDSKDFEDMKNKAVTCNVFYKRSELSKDSMSEHIAAHRSNIGRMQSSVAKEWVKNVDLEAKKMNRVKEWFGSDPTKPRAILSKTSSPEELMDREAIADLSQACARLWAPADKASTEAADAKSKARPVKK